MEWDFLIIGGGIAGASAGRALSALGSVCLWEAEDAFGYHASGRSAALFEENYGLPSVVALNRASAASHAAEGWLSPRGLMLVGLEGEEDAFDADAETMRLTPLSVEEARAKMPILSPAVTRAAHDDRAFDLDTNAMLQSGLRACNRAETRRRVTQIEQISGGWRVIAGQVETTARNIVNAAGPWVDRIAVLAGVTPLGVTPYRRSMARLAAPGGHDTRGWPMTFGVGEAWYCKPDAGALIVSPSEEEPCDPVDVFADDMVLAEGLARYQDAVTEEVTRPVATWAGLRTFTPDRCLALGASEVAGFWWCAGQGGYGFQTAPAASAFLADRVAGRPPAVAAEVAAALDPGRFL